MLRAKQSLRRCSRSGRRLRLEPLEPRALLCGQPTNAPVITLHAVNGLTDFWQFEGVVTENGKSVAGLVVHFGGVLAPYNVTATVQSDGTYSVTEEIPNSTWGTATAQTQDADGRASNVAVASVEGGNSPQTAAVGALFAPVRNPLLVRPQMTANSAPISLGSMTSTTTNNVSQAVPAASLQTASPRPIASDVVLAARAQRQASIFAGFQGTGILSMNVHLGGRFA